MRGDLNSVTGVLTRGGTFAYGDTDVAERHVKVEATTSRPPRARKQHYPLTKCAWIPVNF